MSTPESEPVSKLPDEERPPIFRSWNEMYIFVLVLHAIIISLFYFITQTFS